MTTIYTPGDRVAHRDGKHGTVLDDPAMSAEYPGFVPVEWDDHWRTATLPHFLTHEEPSPEPLDVAVRAHERSVKAGAHQRAAARQRDAAVAEAHSAGSSAAEIQEALGISKPRIYQIIGSHRA